MEFARRQLEKYGWKDGKGLGKNENGISEAIKPKLKRSVAGIGHDPAADFTEQWWSQLYDKAAKNVEVKEKNGRTKKIKTKDDQFKITNSTYHLTKSEAKSSEQEEYSDFFVKTVVLTNGGSQERVRLSESEEETEKERKDVFKMTDEELFAACEGRTAHKGARHGLKATGKLARILRQEQELLASPKYTGYSHSKKHTKQKEFNSDVDSEIIEKTSLDDDDSSKSRKKKKKRKHCLSGSNFDETLVSSMKLLENDADMAEINMLVEDEVRIKPKKKKKNRNKECAEAELASSEEVIIKTKKKKKKCNDS